MNGQNRSLRAAEPPRPDLPLKKGDTKDEVKTLKEMLGKLGFTRDDGTPLSLGNKFDDGTLSAVNDFKWAAKLANEGDDIHGVIGVTSWNLLVELSNFEYDRKRFQEGFGDEATVKVLQLRLRQLRFYAGNITGTFDPATTRAVKSFKNFENLGNTGDVAGVVGGQTWDFLMETSHLGSYDAPNEHGFIAPLRTMHVTAGYGDRIYHSNPHMGTDLRGSIGTPIFAVAAGKIRYVDERINTSRGKWIVLEHATTKDRSFYQHNSRNLVVENQDVVQGQIIALAGNTGQVISSRGDGSHLHFELLKNTDNKLQGENKSFEDYRQPKYHVDPKDYIPGVYWVRTE